MKLTSRNFFEKSKKKFSFKTSKRNAALLTYECQNYERKKKFCFKPLICDDLLQQQQETNTDYIMELVSMMFTDRMDAKWNRK